jgi:phosphate transport system permease protein
VSQQAIEQTAVPGSEIPGMSMAGNELLLDLTGRRSRRTSERIIGGLLFICGALSVLTTVGIIAVLIEETISFFTHVSVLDFLTGTKWTPLFKNDQHFGVLPLLTATLQISFVALLVAIPLGMMSAIFLSEYASPRVRAALKPALELLAGIPTIVYGYFALTFITPQFLRNVVPGVQVYNALAAGIAIGIMVLPMIASLSEDAMNSVPRSLREGAYALGATKLEVSTRIVVPAALSGIIAAFILAISRAIGETMIVAIASGLRAQLVWNPRQSMEALTAYIVQVLSGDVVTGSVVYNSLFAVGFFLFLITLLLNICSQWLVARFREVYE